MNPFGGGVPRFDYQKPPVQKTEQVANNGMISVKDKDIWEKRLAAQKTIEMHKKLNELRPNAVFTSNVKRESMFDMHSMASTEDHATAPQTATLNSIQYRSNLTKMSQNYCESVRTGKDPGYAIIASELPTKAAFNATSPRFNYFKDEKLG